MNGGTNTQAATPNMPGELARLSAALSAAQRLAEDLEDETTAEGFDLVTALQCVLAQARLLMDKAEAGAAA